MSETQSADRSFRYLHGRNWPALWPRASTSTWRWWPAARRGHFTRYSDDERLAAADREQQTPVANCRPMWLRLPRRNGGQAKNTPAIPPL
jgi:hypothetical protein